MTSVTRAAFAMAATMFGIAAAAGTASAQPSGSATTGMAVSVAKATHGCFIDQLQVSGTLVAREEFLVRSDTEGLLVSQIMVEDGDRVTSGQKSLAAQSAGKHTPFQRTTMHLGITARTSS